MANGHTIKNYSATDIEKYQQGLLSPAEAHAMEKAALEDPFLADAMEGYADAGTTLQADLEDLKKRLAQRTEEKATVIPLGGAGKSSFPFMRAAVMIGVLAGAGTLAYLFMFKGKEQPIAQAKQEKNIPAAVVTDSGKSNAKPVLTATDSTIQTGSSNGIVNTEKQTSTLYFNQDSIPAKDEKKLADKEGTAAAVASEELVAVNDELKDLAKSTRWKATDLERKRAESAKKENGSGFIAIPAPGKAAPAASDQAKAKAVSPAVASKTEESNFLKTNIFRGRVTDGMNFGVPFAKVTNTDDNVGTYTDARGYFNLTSPDSVLHVQVRSIGFENNASQLRYSVPNNQVILQNDSRSLNALVINNQRANSFRRSDNNNTRLEEPVPADGWENYDTYLSNNLVMPEEYRNKPTTTATAVEVSFEVDAKGEPVNIRVEKSLCDKCDKEAIRLIKEGPKWKQNARNNRTTVTIPFNQLF
ncbi:MAG TPA: carboxypeptidase-like regulatory domain-containing protein [Chitinophagaceae bacterium]|nr:carboxypeptidase-like regulatory domain-containing protein [Chitinophagaceae bacterium]